jgi:hypothetical protein
MLTLCMAVLTAYYNDFPTYWTGTEVITIDAQEESARFCHWLIQ